MLSQVSKWGNSQGVRISKRILQNADININDEVEIKVHNNTIIITPTAKKTLDWYLDGYEDGDDRFDWGDDEPRGRELL